jgi:hypothetical protein
LKRGKKEQRTTEMKNEEKNDWKERFLNLKVNEEFVEFLFRRSSIEILTTRL